MIQPRNIARSPLRLALLLNVDRRHFNWRNFNEYRRRRNTNGIFIFLRIILVKYLGFDSFHIHKFCKAQCFSHYGNRIFLTAAGVALLIIPSQNNAYSLFYDFGSIFAGLTIFIQGYKKLKKS